MLLRSIASSMLRNFGPLRPLQSMASSMLRIFRPLRSNRVVSMFIVWFLSMPGDVISTTIWIWVLCLMFLLLSVLATSELLVWIFSMGTCMQIWFFRAAKRVVYGRSTNALSLFICCWRRMLEGLLHIVRICQKFL